MRSNISRKLQIKKVSNICICTCHFTKPLIQRGHQYSARQQICEEIMGSVKIFHINGLYMETNGTGKRLRGKVDF